MAICRICGVEYTAGKHTADDICNNDGCWRQAWNSAVAPFRKEKAKPVVLNGKHRTTAYEKQRIIALFKSGKSRREIYNEKDIGVSYENICHIIRKNFNEEKEKNK